ncbi:MAG: hypothetical protein AAFX87_29650 [Bacteroidota bacterium]
MLDFHLIKDNESIHSDHTFKYVNGIEIKAFAELQRREHIEERFDYYSDFRWSTEQVKQKLEAMSRLPNLTEAELKLQAILETAQGQGCGLVAFCD